MSKTVFFTCILIFSLFPNIFSQTRPPSPARPDEIIIGKPVFIPYSRAFALLDGLFQDVSAMQIKQLMVDPNNPNATSQEAIIQQFQVTAGFNQLLGIQNAASAQQSATFSSALVFENRLLNQETQLAGLLPAALQRVSDAQNLLNAFPDSTDNAERAAAQQQFNIAKANLDLIKNQIETIKGLRTVATGNANSTSTAAPGPLTLPSPFMNPSAPPVSNDKDKFNISFPASKQMENHINILWERLANLMSTLAQSENNGNIYLIKLNTGIAVGKDRKKSPLLSTQYSLKCTSKDTKKELSEAPTVLDLFPRMAAVNIANQKYKDDRIGLGAILSFFSIGINAAYNREHLRITQALGQSAYITGFGIQTSSFGWIFGPTLGEDIPAPGPRTTFALVSLPTGCDTANVRLVNAVWDKAPKIIDDAKDGLRPSNVKDYSKELSDEKIACNAAGKMNCVERVLYTPVEFDPANPGNSPVTVDIMLRERLDREQTVSVNGVILKRSRDAFGRATPGAANVPVGILQAGDLSAGTWFPVGDHEMILNLNPVLYSGEFPRIFLNSPAGSIDLTTQMGKDSELIIDGRNYKCPQPANCSAVLPAIGRPKGSPKRLSVERWMQGNGPNDQRILFKVEGGPGTSTVPAAAGGLLPVQIVRDFRDQKWSGYARVVAIQENGASVRESHALKCEPMGDYLDCIASGFDNSKSADFEVYDVDYVGSPIKGKKTVEACSGLDCANPFVFDIDPPRWNNSDGWEFDVRLGNVKQGWTAFLKNDTFASGPIKCPVDMASPCEVTITIPKTKFGDVGNSVKFVVREAGGGETEFQISNLRMAISPIISTIEADRSHFTGRNLVWTEAFIEKKGRKIPLTCPTAEDCSILAPFLPTDEGHLYFFTKPGYEPFLQLTDKGLVAVSPFRKKEEDKPDKPEKRVTPATTLQIDNTVRNLLFVTKQQP